MGSSASGAAIRSITRWSTAPGRGTVSQKKATDEFGSLTFNEEE
jgi:hypothetical protein